MKGPPSRKTDDRVFIVSLIIFGLGLTVFGILLEIRSVQLFTVAKERLFWRSTEGSVISSRVETFGSVDKRRYQAEVIYGYSVNGTNYSSKSVSFEDTRREDYFSAVQIVNQYHAGKSITVYYEPENPKVAHLELTEVPYMSMVAVIFCIAAGLLILVIGIVKYQGLGYHLPGSHNRN